VADLIGNGMAFLARQLAANAGISATYLRGSETIPVTVIRSSSLLKLSNEFGALRVVRWEDDWIVATAELMLGGGLFEPQLGDMVRIDSGNHAGTYEVLQPGIGELAWKRITAGNQWRLHTKRIVGGE
jgi:hypothetical protein